jgi:beta-lactamase regulating signal transducer with metallopeptidase domain/peroxiredoxin/Leucine-rich repeat (LRR) protein
VVSEPEVLNISQPSFWLSEWLGENIWMIVLFGWGIVTTISILRVLAGFVRVKRKIISSVAGPKHLQQVLDRVAGDLGCTAKVELRCSAEMSTPFLTGLRRPTVLVPERMIDGRYESKWEAIFAHEIAHLKSRDLMWTLVVRCFEVVMWFHPFIWKVRSAHSAACEEVSDAVAADYIGNTESYSSTLADLALEIIGKVPVIGGIPMARSSEIVARLRILKRRIYQARLARRWIILSGLVSFIALAVIGGINLVYAESDPGKTDKVLSGRGLLRSVQGQDRTRVLHFTGDRSVGTLQVQPSDAETKISLFNKTIAIADGKWNNLGPAEGDVVIPARSRVALSVNRDKGIKDLSPLSKLGANDLHEISFPFPRGDGTVADDTVMPHIAHLTGLKELDLQPTHITAKGLRFIRNFRSLESLHLPARTTDAGLAQITGLQSLKKLKCPAASFTSTGFAHLAKLRSLVVLRLDLGRNCDGGMVYLAKLPLLRSLEVRGNFTDAGLKHISELSALENLDLSDKDLGITNKGLAYISGLSGLEYLKLGEYPITSAGLVHLGGLRSLRHLDIRGTRIIGSGLPHLAQIKSLERLALPGWRITDRDLAHVGKLGKLKFLSVGGSSRSSITDTGLRHLSKLDLLEELHIGGEGITDAGMSHIGRLVKLKRLSILGLLTDEGLAKLTTLKSLNQLEIDTIEGDSMMTISGISRLNGLRELTYLQVDGAIQDNSGLDISGLTKLEELIIRGSVRLSDQDLACFANLTHLKKLRGIDGISDVSAAYLKNLTSMERLNIGGPNWTDKGLTYLSNMKKLDSLNITGDFTDKGLRYLEGLKSLGSLRIHSANNFSPAALKHLQSRLPNLFSFDVKRDREIGRGKSKRERIKVGDVAPSFAVKTLDGKDMKLEDYRGKAVLLYFWATWCRPCVAGTPKRKEFYGDLKASFGDDFEMISLSLDDNEYPVRQHVKKHKLTWPQVCLRKHSKLTADYGLDDNRAPQSLLIGPDGKILLAPESPQVDTKSFIEKVLKNRKP